MKIIPLSVTGRKYAGLYSALVDDEDYEIVSSMWWNPLIKARTTGPYVRAIHSVRQGDGWQTTFMHRVIYERAHGIIPSNLTVDHVVPGEFGGLDNRRANLRLATGTQQRANSTKRIGAVSIYKGVARVTGADRWQANVQVDGRNRYLGTFRDEVEAARAYDKAALHAFGPYANINFPQAYGKYDA